jgi:hypothetical protein
MISDLSSSVVMWSVELDQWEGYLWKTQEMAFVNVKWLCTIFFSLPQTTQLLQALIVQNYTAVNGIP